MRSILRVRGRLFRVHDNNQHKHDDNHQHDGRPDVQLSVSDVLRIGRWGLYVDKLFPAGERATEVRIDNDKLRLQHDHDVTAWLQPAWL